MLAAVRANSYLTVRGIVQQSPPMPSYTDSDIPGAFLPYWRQALDRSPDEAKELMAQFISDLADILLRTEGAKEGQEF